MEKVDIKTRESISNGYRHFERTVFVHNENYSECINKLRNIPTAMILFDYFMEKMDKKNNVKCSMDTLQEITSRKRPTIAKAIKALVEIEAIDVIDKDVYHVSENIVFK